MLKNEFIFICIGALIGMNATLLLLTYWFDLEFTVDNIISIVGGALTVAAALYALDQWKRQLKGTTDYQIARRYLRAVFELRDALNFVRNPAIFPSEEKEALKRLGESGKIDADDNETERKTKAVYYARWEKVANALSSLEIEIIEAEISWGKSARDIFTDLDSCVKKLNATIWLNVVAGKSEVDTDIVIYNTGEENDFTKEVNKSVLKIDDYLRKYLN